MAEPTREELEAKLAEMQRQMDALQKQLAAERSGKAAGERGVAADTVDGDVLTGDRARKVEAQQYVEHQTNQQLITDPTRAEPQSLRRAYLSQLYAQAGELYLLGVDPNAAGDKAASALRLDAIYTALLTKQLETERDGARWMSIDPEARAERRISAVAELNRQRRLVLLGDPGSGKSTFVNFVALCLAGEALAKPEANLALLTAPLPADDEEAGRKKKEEAEPQAWDHGALLPVRIVLRELASQGLPPVGQPATLEHFWNFVGTKLAAIGLADYKDLLRKELLEQGGLILLDGLDEVAGADERRGQMTALIEALDETFDRCRMLVTSRTYAYQQQTWQLKGFAATQLAPLSAGQIRTFVDRWYAHAAQQGRVSPDAAPARAELLKHAIFASDRLRALAERPLLLTLMASLHAWRGGNLPERREELYSEAVDLLLDRWESQRVAKNAAGELIVTQLSLAEYLKVDREQLKLTLSRLAFAVHASQKELVDVANIDEGDLLAALAQISRNAQAKANPLLLVDYLSQRTGLLLPHSVGVYTFPHRTFQEYLAARYLTEEDYPKKLVELACRDPLRWREVALLAGAKAAHGTSAALWLLVDALCYRSNDEWSEEASWGAHLAGQLVVETVDLAQVSPWNQSKIERVRSGLRFVMRESSLPAVERALAGRNLATLGDPRPEVLTVEQMHFCTVPAGPFEMGDGNKQHTNPHLNYDYWMARYPVTNAQFQQFVDAGGYGHAGYWPEAIKAEFWSGGMFKVWDNERSHSYDFGEPFNLPNHPVVGVSWYEALAFTHWLTDYLRDQLPTGWRIALPSEAEWEKAARGGEEVPAQPQPFTLPAPNGGVQPLGPNSNPTRVYPWPDDGSVSEQANCEESNIAQPSAVGCFAGGASPYGVEEMSGNIWEWTRTLRGFDYPYDPTDGREDLNTADSVGRMIRGGSWFEEIDAVGCGARGRRHPYNWHFNIGFRIVASPSTSGL
jgi:formylglycine-generating enzyme required for sulfatase activity